MVWPQTFVLLLKPSEVVQFDLAKSYFGTFRLLRGYTDRTVAQYMYRTVYIMNVAEDGKAYLYSFPFGGTEVNRRESFTKPVIKTIHAAAIETKDIRLNTVLALSHDNPNRDIGINN